MAQAQPGNVDRTIYTSNEGESRNGPGDVPGVQGCYYIDTGAETRLSDGARIGTPGKGSVLALDSVDGNGLVQTWLFFVDSSGNLRRLAQAVKPSTATPLTPGSVLPVIPMPNTESDGTVVGP